MTTTDEHLGNTLAKDLGHELAKPLRPFAVPKTEVSLMEKLSKYETIGHDLSDQINVAGTRLEHEYRQKKLALEIDYETKVVEAVRALEKEHVAQLRSLDEEFHQRRHEHALLVNRLK